jgi:DNA repair protein RadA/Sms
LVTDSFLEVQSFWPVNPAPAKSRPVLQILKWLKTPSLCVAGESSQQLKLEADRLKISSEHILLVYETNVRKVSAHIHETAVKVVVVDSIQTMYSDLSGAYAGSPGQIRKCASVLRRLAQENNLVLILVGQVTKNLKAAGPQLLRTRSMLCFHLKSMNPQNTAASSRRGRTGLVTPRCDALSA